MAAQPVLVAMGDEEIVHRDHIYPKGNDEQKNKKCDNGAGLGKEPQDQIDNGSDPPDSQYAQKREENSTKLLAEQTERLTDGTKHFFVFSYKDNRCIHKRQDRDKISR